MGTFAQFFENMDIVTVLTVPAALLAIMFHEISHGLIAYRLGDNTAKEGGRLSLNPIRHIDIIGLLMLIVAGFGWAKPVPVDMRYFKNPKLGMSLVALAGPVSNFILAFVSYLILSFLTPYVTAIWTPQWIAWLFLQVLAQINVGLGVFNLIPIPPLDGSKMLGAFLPDRLYYQVLRYERYGMAVLMVLLWSGVADKPLSFLRNTVAYALQWTASWPAWLLSGLLEGV